MSHPPLLIESWLPIEAIGAESLRDASAARKPPLNRLHVWWARRPLTVSRAAILGGVLPQWSPDWPVELRQRFPSEDNYRKWFRQFLGILGDPVQGRDLLLQARQAGKIIANPYTYPRAFTINPSAEDLALMQDLLEHTWGTCDLSVLDPFAGGGSIPFEALRYGFTTIANDLNPVAAVILKATLDFPARFGPSLADDIRKWGQRWYELVKPKLQPYFTPLPPGAEGAAYLWARTVACPVTCKPVPLSPNWWLRKGSDPVAVRLIAEPGMDAPQFAIVTGRDVAKAKPDAGTISRGVGRSPWTGQPIDGDYIKAEAQAGRMGQVLYTVAVKVTGGFEFRAPTRQDLEAWRQAEEALARKKTEWIARDIIPTETFPGGNDNRPLIYGMPRWSDFFAPRQLLSIAVFREAQDQVIAEMRLRVQPARAEAIETYLGVMLDKVVIYNNRNCRFDPGRGIRSVFDRHDFAFVSSHAEFDASANLLPWSISQIADAYREIAELVHPSQTALGAPNEPGTADRLSIYQGSASNLVRVPSSSVNCITVDPPYYDNVQYAELSDFFYVWLKRSVGHLFPEFFGDELTNKDDEAVANPARFEAMGSKKKKLAEQDYERKMAAAFREMHRVLRPDGVLTVMFTHKRVEAWDTLATALISAGFAIKASWPVHTESEHSLHQAKKNAASSTILLVCRKREASRQVDKETSTRGPNALSTPSDLVYLSTPSPLVYLSTPSDPVWWEDIQGQVRSVAREKAREYMAQGMRGVDLYISTFGPTLSVISEHWPVLTSEIDPKTGQPKPLRPDTALDLAREEVIRLRKEGLLEGRNVQFDPVTDWYVMAWDAFAAEEFPYDEGRKLAIALGLEMDSYVMTTKRIAAKKGQYVVMQGPAQRRKKGMVDPDLLTFSHWIDALHTAMLVYEEDGPGACDLFLLRTGLKRDATFKAVLQTLLNAIPRTQVKGQFVRPEAAILDNLRLAFYADELTAPVELSIEGVEVVQLGLNLEQDVEEFDSDEED